MNYTYMTSCCQKLPNMYIILGFEKAGGKILARKTTVYQIILDLLLLFSFSVTNNRTGKASPWYW